MNSVEISVFKCYICLEEKGLDSFYKDRSKSLGIRKDCKDCVNVRAKTYRDHNKEAISSYRKEYYKKNKADINKRNSEYQRKNCKALSQKKKLRIEKNKERFLNQRREYKKRRKESNPIYKVTENLRNRLYYSLKSKKWNKDTHFSEYIGCEKDKLISHLESQFIEGMSWENYGLGAGKWSIDHIIPLSSAKTEKELYELCHYSNLQPLWFSDNCIKSNRI